jgi:DNA-binding SARP family transcriptional activator/WD40 repeat protein
VGIAVLGPLRIDDDAVTLGRRDRTVLAALAMHPGEEVRTERLFEVLWGETPPASAAKVVQGCVVRLRKTLGTAAIATTPSGYRLALPGSDIDSARFDSAVERGLELVATSPDRAASILRDALASWRGPPLPELEEWEPGRAEAVRLSQLRLEAEEAYIDAALRCGDHVRAHTQALLMVDREPLRERRWLLLARADYQDGRQADALETIRRLREHLADELGLDAGVEADALEQAILHQEPGLDAPREVPVTATSCPYPGLMAYEVEDSAAFFGRDADVSACLRRLREVSVLAVVGRSGSGKSSVVRAGVAASLLRDGRKVAVLTPGDHPMAALAAVMATRTTVLVVDQCEEAFTLCRDGAERQQFLDALADRTRTGQLVLSMRADHLEHLAAHPAFARVVERGLYLLGAMAEPDLREAIEGPARRAGLLVEAGLVDLLVNEVESQPGALPLLSHTLSETWHRREGRTLTLAAYQESGGIRGAVAMSAEAVYAAGDEQHRAALRDVMLRLVTLGEDGVPLRSRLPRRAVVHDEAHDDVLDRLVAGRLVTSDDGVVELAHEALARAWPRLRGWLDEDVDGQRIRQHLTVAAEAWDALGRPDSELYRGVRLAAAVSWRRASEQPLPEVESDFLREAERRADGERLAAEARARRQARANRTLRGLLGAAAVLLLAALLAGLLAVRQATAAERARSSAVGSRQLADRAATVADSRRLGASALTTDDISLSLLLAIEGVRLDDSSESRANLAAVLARRPALTRTLVLPGRAVGGLTATSTSWHLAVADGAGRLQFLDRALGRLGSLTVGPAAPPGGRLIPVSAPGSYVAVGYSTPTARPVVLVDGYRQRVAPRRLGGFPPQGSRALALAYSHDGQHLAAVLGAGTEVSAYVWDLKAPQRPHRVRLPPGPQGVALSPDGGTVYTTWPAAAYDVRTGARRWLGTARGRLHLDLDPQGRVLAMPRWDGRSNDHVVLLDARDGHVERDLVGHGARTDSVQFAPDGRVLASSADDATVQVWDARTGEIRARLATGQVNGLSFSPDSSHIATTGVGSDVHVWDLSGRESSVALTSTGPGLPSGEGGVSVAPNGLTVATVQHAPGGHSRLSFLHTIVDERSRAVAVDAVPGRAPAAWSPDSSGYATGGSGTVETWDPTTARRTAAARVGDSAVTDLAYTKDGRGLIVADSAGRVRLLGTDLRPREVPVRLRADACCVAPGPRAGTAVVFSDPQPTGTGPAGPSHSQWNLVDLRHGRVLASRATGLDAAAAALSPDGRRLAAVGTDGGLWLFDADGKSLVRPPLRDPRRGAGVAWSSDGRLVATTDEEGGVALWNGASGKQLNTSAIEDGAPSVPTFLYGGQVLELASVRGGVYEWTFDRSTSLAAACRLAGRGLTHAEWNVFVGGRGYQHGCDREAPANSYGGGGLGSGDDVKPAGGVGGGQ